MNERERFHACLSYAQWRTHGCDSPTYCSTNLILHL